jgi:hypothetical protein
MKEGFWLNDQIKLFTCSCCKVRKVKQVNVEKLIRRQEPSEIAYCH